jgi:hypothetical protein
MVYPTRRTNFVGLIVQHAKKTSESKAFCTSKRQNNQTWINLTRMGTFSNQKKNICSHFKKERYLPKNIFKTLLLSISSSGDSYRPLLNLFMLYRSMPWKVEIVNHPIKGMVCKKRL